MTTVEHHERIIQKPLGMASREAPDTGTTARPRPRPTKGCNLWPKRLGWSAMKAKGTVYLVGAGPGDAGLLTLRGAELLARADVVVYDALVNPQFLKLAPKSAEVIFAGKRARDHAIPQEELNRLLVEKAS